MEWRSWQWNWLASGPVISYQVKLYESDNHIEFIYRQESNAVNSGSASIGIQDAAGNFQSLNNTGSSPTPSSTTETTSLNTKPATGQIYSWTPPVMAPMTYSSSTTTQNNTTDVSLNSSNNEVIGIEIVTTGTLSPIDATSFTFNTTGTTDPANDIANARLWYTGTSSTFATTTQVGSVVANPNGTFTINGTQTLATGTNYFWLTYDVPSGATAGNVIDAQCTSVTVDGSAHTPTTTAPAGNRTIVSSVIIGTGTDVADDPFYNYYENEKTQILYLASDIGGAADLTTMAFDIKTCSPAGYQDFQNLTIKMKQTSVSNFNSYTDYFDMSGATTVYSNATEVLPTTTGWYTFDITDFPYDGTNNLVVEIVWGDNGTYTSTNYEVNGTNTSTDYYVIRGYADSETPPSYDEKNYIRPNIKFGTAPSSAAPMAYSSSTTTQNNTNDVSPNTTNDEVIGIEIVTTGVLSPIDATSFTFNTTGTTDPANDIANAKLWYTGTSSTFATTTQVGSVVSNPNGTFTINGTQTLASGTNYFWLTYDVPNGATVGNVIDAQCTSITVDGSNHTPTVTAPAGNRMIGYCEFSNSSGGSYYIDDFSTTGGTTNITNNNSGFSANGYGNFTSMTVTQEQGVSVDFSVAFGSSTSYTFGFSIWVDWNQDGDFADTDENVFISSSYSSSFSGSFTVPTAALTGDTRMRIVADYSDSSPSDPCCCADEVEDYTFHVDPGTPMTISSITTTQNNTTDFYKGLNSVEIIGIEITTTGHVSPLNVNSFTLNTNGSTDASTDITNAKLWTTGTSSTFATTTQIGNIVSSPNGTFTISSGSNLPYTLETGTNYFWLTYDVPMTATVNDFVDAECTNVNIDGTDYTPTTTAPAGNRKIIAPPTFDGTFSSGSSFAANGMTVVNDAVNIWEVGSATGNPVDAAYVTDGSGPQNDYDNTATSVSHFYFDYLFPSGQTIITLSFDWKCDGEGSFDNLKVFVEPTTETPVAGTQNNSTYQVGSTYYSENTTWTTENITLPTSYAGTIKRIVFQWKNDGSLGDNPPAAVDNIIIDTHAPAAPNCAENLSPADGTADLCNANITLTWDTPSSGDAPEGYFIYFGTDNPPTNVENGTDLGNVNSYDPGTLTENTTYYWQIVPYNAGGVASGCSIYSFSTGNGQSNDLPCNAEHIDLGSTASGNNDCTSDDNEPSSPSCWTTGDLNTVWYSFVAPPSGSVDIVTVLGTINSTQIAVYSGTCTSLSLVSCNQDAPSCGSSYQNSSFTVSGLISGATYYVRVDGESNDVGDFNISIAETGNLPLTYGQDCGIDNAIPVCDLHFNVGDPGFQAIGNNCDFDGSQDCTGGERGAVWYDIVIDANGTLTFTLIPNDYDPSGSLGNETDYDFLLYRVASGSTDSSVVDCSCINDNTCGPIRCNFDYLGITGMNGTGTATAPYSPDYDDAFEAELDVLAGDEFYLVIQNYSNSTSGFDIDFGTSPIAGTGGGSTPSSLTWTGGANSTDWYDPLNWGDCSYYPNENIDANIIASSTYQPVIDATDPNNGNNARAKSLNIASGANLTINSGQTLEIYGDYTNNGVLNANPNSTVQFTGSANQTLDGSLQGASAFGNVTVTHTAGTVTTLQDIEIDGSFTTTNNNSIFDLNNKTFYLGGNFSNASGSTTFTGTSSSTFVFNGGSTQYFNTGGPLQLHNVQINNTGTGNVNLQSDLVINNSGSITFTNGIINTNTYKVDVRNPFPISIITGNTNSYVNGNLRRYIMNNTSTYNFPIGDATRYCLAQIVNNHLNPTSYLDAKFLNSFSNTGSLNPAIAQDGGTPYQTICTEGIWQIDPNVQPTSGSYNILLWFNDGGGTNPFSGLTDNQFGPLKRPSSSSSASDWSGEPVGDINAIGQPGRTVSSGYAQRNAITSFSHFSIGLSSTILPVSLVDFSSFCEGDIIKLTWTTATEINNCKVSPRC
ncbi:MAG: hypothetical protein Kow0068_09690 [Marinilabiliales bacterium]